MISGWLQRITSVGIWGTVCALFSLFAASGGIIIGGLLLSMVLLVVAIIIGPQLISALWLMGSPTVFGFPNEILRPLPFVTMERLLVGLMALMVFLQIAFSKTRNYKLSDIETLILIYLCYAFVSLVYSTTPETMTHDAWFLIQYALPMGSYIISRRIEWSEQGIRVLLVCLTITGVFLAIVGILQAVFGISIFTMSYQDITSGHTNRAYGTFSNAHTYIATLVIFLIVTLLQFSLYKDPMIKAILLLAMVVMIAGIILGKTRAPWLGAAISIFIIFLYDKKVRPLLVIGGILGSVAAMALLFIMIDQLGDFLSRITNLDTLAGRLAVWATAVNMIVHNPVFGVGFTADSFLLHKAEYITGIGPLTAQYAVYLGVPHNEYIHVGVLLGIPGMIIFITILYKVVRKLFEIHHDSKFFQLRRKMSIYIGAIFAGLMFNSLFSDTFIQDYFWAAAFFLAGLASRIPADFDINHSGKKLGAIA